MRSRRWVRDTPAHPCVFLWRRTRFFVRFGRRVTMLDLKYVVEHLDEIRSALARRGPLAAASLDRIEQLALERRTAIHAAEVAARSLNEASTAMAAIADKRSASFEEARGRLRKLGDEKKELEKRAAAAESEIVELLARVPNV